jgi:hypothetical protein
VSCFLFMPLRAAWAGERIVNGKGTKYTQEICYIPLALLNGNVPNFRPKMRGIYLGFPQKLIPWFRLSLDILVCENDI